MQVLPVPTISFRYKKTNSQGYNYISIVRVRLNLPYETEELF